jgi:hypothetical protein
MSDDDTQPNRKYAKVEKVADSLLTKLVASPWTGPISGVLILLLIAFGIWLKS